MNQRILTIVGNSSDSVTAVAAALPSRVRRSGLPVSLLHLILISLLAILGLFINS
ncbi:MAG: hypothetical protein AB1428_04115 [Bacteroidota bacterium]